MTTPSVAVVIAARNAAPTIGRAVRSALAQPEAAEVHVVDDASEDGTADTAAACGDGTDRLALYRLPVNQGPSGARNHALERIAAPWACVLDADDYFLPGRLEELLGHVRKGDRLVADNLIIRPSGEDCPDGEAVLGTLWDDATGPKGTVDGTIGFAAFVRANISRRGSARRELGFLKPLLSMDFLRQHGLRYRPSVRLGEDYLLYAEALARGARMRLVPPCGYVAVVRPGSLSHAHEPRDLLALAEGDAAIEAAIPGLSAGDRAALRAHRASVLRKWHYRAMLDAKRQRRYGAALRHAAADPATISFVVRQLVQDKLGL